jgi:tripartite-type tricarboxylate transporter receptor subunit TctC
MKSWRVGVTVAAGLALLAMSGPGRAQESFPNRPIRLVVPPQAFSP